LESGRLDSIWKALCTLDHSTDIRAHLVLVKFADGIVKLNGELDGVEINSIIACFGEAKAMYLSPLFKSPDIFAMTEAENIVSIFRLFMDMFETMLSNVPHIDDPECSASGELGRMIADSADMLAEELIGTPRLLMLT